MGKPKSGAGFEVVDDDGNDVDVSTGISVRRVLLIAGLTFFAGAWVLGLAYIVIQHQRSKSKDSGGEVAIAEPKKDWLDTTEEFQQGSIRLKVMRVGILRPELVNVVDRVMTLNNVKDAGRMMRQQALSSSPEYPERCFCLRLWVRSMDQNEPLKFEGWGDVGNFTIKDELGNKYQRVRCDPDHLFDGQFAGKNAIVYSGEIMSKDSPGGNANDLIVVTDPKREAKTLYIDLPAEAFGGHGVIKYRWTIDRFVRSNIPPAPKTKGKSK